jgi:hypothetical protein
VLKVLVPTFVSAVQLIGVACANCDSGATRTITGSVSGVARVSAVAVVRAELFAKLVD